MTLRSTDAPGAANVLRTEAPLPVSRELAEPTARERKLRGGIHPSLRALPDYPAR